MISILRSKLCMLAVATVLSMAFTANSAPAQSFSAPQRTEIEGIIKDYLLKHPEVLEEAMKELEKRQTVAERRGEMERHLDDMRHLAEHPLDELLVVVGDLRIAVVVGRATPAVLPAIPGLGVRELPMLPAALIHELEFLS
jgi:hypothetical protein